MPSKKPKNKKNVLSIFLIIVFIQIYYPLANKPAFTELTPFWSANCTPSDEVPFFMTNGMLEATAMQKTIDYYPFPHSKEIKDDSPYIGNEATLYCNVEEYVSTNSYPNANTEVYYDCKIWKNQWYANPNEVPGDNNVWAMVSDCTEGPGCTSSFCDISEYEAAYSYPNSNTKVYYECMIWKNQWYANPNEIPGENNVWLYVSDCDEGNGCLLSVPENETNTMSVYPNPSSDFIEISKIEVKKDYEIYGLNGQFIFDGIIGRNEKIDIRNLNSGVYFIHFKDFSIKFIKE